MISKLRNSIYVKQLALLMVCTILFMSFKTNGDGTVTLSAGTSIPLATVSMIQSDLVSVGQMIDFKVQSDIKVEGKTVVAAGSIAKGQVMRAQKARGLGRAGFLEIQIRSVVATDGQEIFLTGANLYQEGQDQQTLAILLGVFICILFLTIEGKDAQVPAGYQVYSTVATNMMIKA